MGNTGAIFMLYNDDDDTDCMVCEIVSVKSYLKPHTPDNTFLGFVVEQHLNASDIRHIDDIKRQNQSLVYGKVDNFWKCNYSTEQVWRLQRCAALECKGRSLHRTLSAELVTSGGNWASIPGGISMATSIQCGGESPSPPLPLPPQAPLLLFLSLPKPLSSSPFLSSALCQGKCCSEKDLSLSCLPDSSSSTAQHSTAQHSTAQHSTAQHSTAQHSTAQHSTDKKKYLDIIHQYTEVHATVHGTSTVHLPGYVRNHGILSGRDLQFLLRETKLFVGLSFPYEGPAPLEAIANGCAFLNPKFTPPKSSKNTDFFKGKPTLRELTSQHPYAEVYIGKPHVWTVDIENPQEVQRAVRAILSQKIEPYLPYEFTCEGMLQRVNALIEKQDFCHGQVMWPPLAAMRVKLAEPGRSCKQVCQEEQLICEPSFFQHLNKDKDLARFGVDCQTVESSGDTVVPAFNEARKHCVFQSDLLLFSCAGAHASLKRVCPCRDYMKGQVALCQNCL
ncbi:hypothetical protein ACEWY4_016729 [Coilia grayii]|uniref:alpha-1,6-mannosyl-glycoprotein 6-beta-N-acetylglucosaminyltransferase n=1 Tax=Coilia grayii TaxID=363190 RepID=A0ABD1JMD5_9TELE